MCNKISHRIVGKIIAVDRSTKDKSSLMGNMKSTLGLGVGSMAGMGIMGAMPQTPGAGNITGTVGSSMNLLNVGQLSKNAMDVTKIMHGKMKKHGKY